MPEGKEMAKVSGRASSPSIGWLLRRPAVGTRGKDDASIRTRC